MLAQTTDSIKQFQDLRYEGGLLKLTATPFISSRSTGQTIKRQTDNLKVDYYVSRDFKSEFRGSAMQQIEKNVEDDYVSNVRNNCWKEKQTSE